MGSWLIFFLSLSLSGTLQLRYNLGGMKEPFVVDVDQRNLANGQPHTVNISRVERSIQVQVHYRGSYSLHSSPTVTYCRGEHRMWLNRTEQTTVEYNRPLQPLISQTEYYIHSKSMVSAKKKCFNMLLCSQTTSATLR